MKRRSFLAGSLRGTFTTAATAWLAPAVVAGEKNAHASGAGCALAQSNDGVVIHPFESDVMKGCPPPKEKTVTPDTHPSSRPHRVWAHQHMRELCATQPIGRGDGPVVVLPRKPRDVDGLPVTGPGGEKTTVAELLKLTYTDAFLVLHDGAIVTEQYFSGMTPDTPHHLWSASKSISIGVVANLLAEGKLEEDAPVVQYVPELAASGYQGATIWQLMDMQSGVKYDYAKEDFSAVHLAATEGGRHSRAAGMYRRLHEENPNEGQYAFLPTLQRCRDHGSIFYYKCCDTAVLAWACEKVTGTRFAELVSKHIWSKVGAEHDAYTICDVQGFPLPHAGLSVTLRDLARWGQMHLQGGVFQGRQVVPRPFIEDFRTKADPNKVTKDSFLPPDVLLPGTAYRSQFWISGADPVGYYASGAYGQYCYIHPECNTVIVKFSTHEANDFSTPMTEIRAFGEIARALAG